MVARMFVDQTLAKRIEQAEAAMTRDGARALARSGRAPTAFVRELGSGVAACLRPGCALNKVIGIGLDGPLDPQALSAVEAGFRELGEPVRAEISTRAPPELWEQLAGRGYRLAGFENVLVGPAGAPTCGSPEASRSWPGRPPCSTTAGAACSRRCWRAGSTMPARPAPSWPRSRPRPARSRRRT
jgi:hypothetical protein